jgi:hypothetical protein
MSNGAQPVRVGRNPGMRKDGPGSANPVLTPRAQVVGPSG